MLVIRIVIVLCLLGVVQCTNDCAKIGTRKPFNITADHKYGLWPGLTSAHDLKYGENIFGVEEAIERIWKNQHPPDCSKAKYLISGEWHAGFGSEHYYHTINLGLALESGRVFIHEGGHPWRYENPFCEKQGKISMLCYLLPYSNCTMDDAYHTIPKSYPKYTSSKFNTQNYGTIKNKKGEGITLERIASGRPRYPDEPFHFDTHVNDNVIMIKDDLVCRNHYHAVPYVMRDLIDCANVTKGTEYLWWRSIALAYQLRPNPVVLKLIDDIRNKTVQHSGGRCVSTFVRHGDKYKEMTLQPFKAYSDVAEILFDKMDEHYAQHPDETTAGSNKNPPPRLLYLNAEDHKLFDEAKKWGDAKNVQILYSDLSQTIHREKNPDPHSEVRHPMEYFSYFLHLADNLACLYHICTQASNSCRMIDNIRATLGGKANTYNVDLSPESCKDPPCYREYALGNFQGELHNPRNMVWR